MKRTILFTLGIAASVCVSGCSSFIPHVDPITQAETDNVPESSSTAAVSETIQEPTTEASDATEVEAEETAADSFSTDTSGNLVIDIGISAETTSASSSSGHMEDSRSTYTINNITINYPVIVGMSDTDTQAWANKELYNDAMSIIELYDVDTENDTLTVDYEVSECYRSKFNLVYTGVLQQASSHDEIAIRLSDDLDLTQQQHVRLSDRLSASKLATTILETGDYTVLSTNFDEDTLRNYLSSQSTDFYTSLISTADFGGSEAPVGFSYNSMGNVAVIIPVPHMFGDYAEISIAQQTK